MAVHPLLPNIDFRNQGWSLVGAGISALYQALSNDDDNKYVKSPPSKNEAAVRFPVDITDVPEGAVVTSVTLKMRAGLGQASAPAGTIPSISVALSADDNTARFVTRTIYPTTTSPQTFEVATFDRDARGFEWDIERINHIVLKFFSYVGIFDLIRIFKLFCEVNYRYRPTVTIEAPNGTVLTPSPVIGWKYSQQDGDPQRSAEYKIFTAVQRTQVGFNPETSEPVYHGTVEGDIQSLTLPTSLNPDEYWLYVRVQSTFRALSAWTGRQFSVSGPAPGTPGVPGPAGQTVGMIQVVPDSEGGAAQLTLRDTSNLLSAQTADAESSIEGAPMSTVRAILERDTSKSFPGGTSSWKVTASGGGDTSIYLDHTEVDSSGAPMTARAQFLAGSTGRSCRVRIQFFDSQFLDVGSLTGDTVTDAGSTWREASVTGAVPAGATYAQVALDILGPAASEVHYLDRLGLMYGTDTPWSSGGQASRNLLSTFYSTAEGNPLSGEAWTAGVATSTGVASPPGIGASGGTCHRMTYLGLTPTIAWRGAGTTWNSATSGVDYTLNKPAAVVAGDLMLAYITCNESMTDITPPTGWTVADTVRLDDGSVEDSVMFILKRTAGANEPASWTDGVLTAATTRRSAFVVAYSGAADAAQQFLASGSVASGNPAPLYATTVPMVNTDPGAWRISAFAVSDNASGGTLTANRQQPSSVPGIEFVGRATAWGTAGNGTSFTINKPSGVREGDLMIATVAAAAETPTVNPPTGWTIVENQQSSSADFVLVVLRRYATASEPNSWTGSLSNIAQNFDTRISQCVAYRNVDPTTPFLAEAGTLDVDGQTLSTPTVTNSKSGAWRVCAFGADCPSSGGYGFTSNEVSERCDEKASSSGGVFGGSATSAAAMYDSNGPISTGNYSRSGTFSTSYHAMVAWIGILNPLGTPPSPVADETARQVVSVGSANPWLTTRVFDSNGIVPTGSMTVSGIWAPGSGGDLNSILGWSALIVPAAPATSGYASAKMASTVDLTGIDALALRLAGGKVAVTASFVGTVASVPYLTLHCWRANQLLNSFVVEGDGFGTDRWVKSAASFDIPDGTTRVSMSVAASNLGVNDIVYFDRLSIALGDALGYRPGSSRSTHPVWSRPDIQFADDTGAGYTDFEILPGSLSNSPSFDILSGSAIHTDHTIVPLTNRKYRARTVVYGLAGDRFVSPYGPESGEFSFEAQNWWIKDIDNPDNSLRLSVKWDPVTVKTTNTAAVFQPMGSALPVVLTEGYKGDTFTLKLTPVSQSDWAKLYGVLKSGRTLFLQSDVNHAWWVRPIGDLESQILPTNTRRSKPLREITVNFVEVEPEL